MSARDIIASEIHLVSSKKQNAIIGKTTKSARAVPVPDKPKYSKIPNELSVKIPITETVVPIIAINTEADSPKVAIKFEAIVVAT